MGIQPEVGELERQVLAAVGPHGRTTAAVAEQLGQPAEAVDAAVARLVDLGLVEAAADAVRWTRLGGQVAAGVRGPWPSSAEVQAATVDLARIARSVGAAWSAQARRRAAHDQAARAALLAADADRDVAVRALSDAFSQGRLSSGELEERTGKALSARTHGQLDDLFRDLGGLQRPVRSHPVRKAVFWTVAFLLSPFVLLGTLALAFGSDGGDRFGGLVFLVVLLPGLFGLRRWAWPRG